MTRTRTNYFAVTDKDTFKELINDLVTGENTPVIMMENEKGKVGFYCDDIIYGMRSHTEQGGDCKKDEEMEMVYQIEDLLQPGSACVIIDSNSALVITKNDAESISKSKAKPLSLIGWSARKAQEMLGDPTYILDMVRKEIKE